MDLGKYTAVTKPLAIEFEGEILNITYRPNVYTLGLTRELEESVKEKDIVRQAEIFARLLASWDLYNDNEIVPLTAEGILQVPMQVLSAIDSALEEAVGVSEDEKKGSSEPSANPPTDSTPPLPSSPNGSETTESQTVSASPSTS